MNPVYFGLLTLFFSISIGSALSARSSAKELTISENPRVVNLATALELASKNNLELLAQQTLIDQASAKESLAGAQRYPKVIGTAILSPIYSAKGDPLYSQHEFDKWGIWLQSSVTILQPVFTWGKLSSLREAAARGSDVAHAQVTKDRNQLSYDVKELFYGAILTEQLYNFLDDGKKEITELLNKAEQDQNKKRPTISKRDFFRLKIFAAEADYRLEEASKLRFLARHALSLKLGFDPNEETVPQDTSLQPIAAELPDEEELLKKMKAARPEFIQLQNGIAAKRALLTSISADKYPMVFAGGMLTFAYSNVRNHQQSAYAFDPYNRNTGGVGIGVQWTWDFATTLANEAGMRAEIDELEKKQAYAKSGFRLELKKVLMDLKEAKARVDVSKNAFQVGKKWLTSESVGYSVGLTEVKNLVDAYLARAKTTKDYWDAIYKWNMAWAELSKTVGTEVLTHL